MMKQQIILILGLLLSNIVWGQTACYNNAVPTIRQYYQEGKLSDAKQYIADMEELCEGTPTYAFKQLKEEVYSYTPPIDTDGDGVLDKDDKCPNTRGLSELKGCPDTDGDGISDVDDECPNKASPFSNNGCPKLETFTETVNGVRFKMVAIADGRFAMGSNDGDSDEQPIHQVNVPSFYMGETEVTQALWQAVMGNNPSFFTNCDQCPVESVTWNDAQAFIEKLNRLTGKRYRLPSESEWEYATRAGTSTPFYTGNNITTSQANYNGNYPYKNNAKGIYREKTMAVKSFAANPWGLYDMSGNVYEWCKDKWHDSYTGAPTNGSAWTGGSSSRRVLRGGSWFNNAESCRSVDRPYYSPGGGSHLGFRLALAP